MQAFSGQFTLPRLERVIAGPGTLDALPLEIDRYACRRVLLVTGTTVGASPLAARVRDVLQHRHAGSFAAVPPHVPASSVAALVSAIGTIGADCVVSLGGGSAIDAVKGAAHALMTRGGAEVVHIALPTTLSAGEFTDVAGITDEQTRIKHAVREVRLAPRTVIADPMLALDTPDWLWAASGIRALDHAIESLYSRSPHRITEPLAERAIGMLLQHLPRSIGAPNPDRVAHRGECQMAAWLAVFGVTNAGFGLSHLLGHQIGPRWNVAHGLTSAVMLPHAMRFMSERAPGRFGAIARALGAGAAAGPQPTALACTDRVKAFVAELGLPSRLRDLGVPAAEFTQIAEVVAAAISLARALDHRVTAQDVQTLLEAAY